MRKNVLELQQRINALEALEKRTRSLLSEVQKMNSSRSSNTTISLRVKTALHLQREQIRKLKIEQHPAHTLQITQQRKTKTTLFAGILIITLLGIIPFVLQHTSLVQLTGNIVGTAQEFVASQADELFAKSVNSVFVSPTPANGSATSVQNVSIKASIPQNVNNCTLNVLEVYTIGSGKDGSLNVSAAGKIVNNYTYLTANTTASNIIQINSNVSFNKGDQVLIIQMQNGSAGIAGQYEFRTIALSTSNSLTLVGGLQNKYYSGRFNTTNALATQVIRVPQYTNITVSTGASITAPAWNGYTGGIVAFRSNGTTLVLGQINTHAKGFRGGAGVIGDIAYAGESYPGAANQTLNANGGGGGGGGGHVNDCGGSSASGGGGAGHASEGIAVGGSCGPITCSADAGLAYGQENLSIILLGSGGGGGGACTGGTGGDGGTGGGAVLIYGSTINITGLIESTGQEGSGADYAGGAGSGGSILLRATNVHVESALVNGIGDLGGVGALISGGNSSDGRLVISATTRTGYASPPASNTSLKQEELTTYNMTITNADSSTVANVTFYNITNTTTINYNVSCVNATGAAQETVMQVLYGSSNKPTINFIYPTPANKTTFGNSNFMVNVSVNQNVTSCTLAINGTNNYGNGADGALTINASGTIVNVYTYLSASSSAGATTLNVNSNASLNVGDELLVIQMANASTGITGRYEFVKISSISGTTLTLTSALVNAYYTGGGDLTQVVRVPQYTTLTLNGSGSITAPAWDGNSGGIVVFRATETVTISGTISATGLGYRGGAGVTSAIAYQGESYTGTGSQSMTANLGAGGGGGGHPAACGESSAAGGGGGGYGAEGSAIAGSCGPLNPCAASAGGAYGLANLSHLMFGSGGGGGGGCGDGTAGNGGAGGGIVLVFGPTITITGSVVASGAAGGAPSGAPYALDAGGGGGAGGSVRLVGTTVTLGGSLTTASGGAGGATSLLSGGAGAVGRIETEFVSATGDTSPSATNATTTSNGQTITMNISNNDASTYANGTAINLLNNTTYSYNVTCTDEGGNTNTTGARTITRGTTNAAVYITLPVTGGTYSRGENDIGTEDGKQVVSDMFELTGYVNDTNGIEVSGATCSFIIDGTVLSNSTTNYSGYCISTWNRSTASIGTHTTNISFNHSAHPTVITQSNSSFSIVQDKITGYSDNMESTERYEDGTAAILQFNITRNGVLIDANNITVNMTNQNEVVLESVQYPGNITRTGTGTYLAQVTANASLQTLLIWNVYVSNDSYSSYLASGTPDNTSVFLADHQITLNITTENTSGAPFGIQIYDDDGYEVMNTDLDASEALISTFSEENLYRLLFTIRNITFELSGVNLTTNTSIIPEYVINYTTNASTKIKHIEYFTPVFALDSGLNFKSAKITLPIVPNLQSICKCETWNTTLDLCLDSWNCTNMSNYVGYERNDTHFWFNVSSFTGYAGGGAYTSNLTIFDRNDTLGGGLTLFTYQPTIFFANYSNSSSGVPIIGAQCNITENYSGSWTNWQNMTYNTTTALYQFLNNNYYVSPITFNWNVTCAGNTSFDALTTNDTIIVVDISPNVTFVGQTPANASTQSNRSVTINVSINQAADLTNFSFNWSRQDFYLYNKSLVLMMSFDNISVIGENDTNVTDNSLYGNNGTRVGTTWTSSGKFGGAMSFSGLSTSYIDLGSAPTLNVGGGNMTVMAWFKYNYSTTNGGGMAILEIGEFTNKYTLTLERGTSETRGTAGFVHNTNWYTDAGYGLNDSQWHHLAATYDGATPTIYIDGKSKAFTTFLGSYTQAAVSRIASAGNYESFNGSIDEIRIWNTSLTATEVSQAYYSSLNKYDRDKWTMYAVEGQVFDAVYNFSAKATDSTGNRNQTLLRTITVGQVPGTSFTTPTPADGSTQANHTVVINVSLTNMTDLANFTFNWSGTTNTIYDKTLVSMLNFDNISTLGDISTRVADISMFADNGRIQGAAKITRLGRFGSAMYFPGTSTSYLDWKTGDNPHLDVAGGNYTVMAWFKYNYSTTNGGGMAILEIGEFTNKYTLTLERGTSETRGTAGFVHNTNWYADAGYGLNDSQWHHLAATYDGATPTIYIDGKSKAFTTFLGSYTQAAVSRIASAGNYESFNGSIDEIRIWNKTLTTAQIQQAYYSSLNKYDIDKYKYLTTQQQQNDSTQNYSAYVSDTNARNVNTTSGQTIIITDTPGVAFVAPTPANVTYSLNASAIFNVSITNSSDLSRFNFTWNGTNYPVYDKTLIAMINFDNVSVLEDTSLFATDASPFANTLRVQGAAKITRLGRFGSAMYFPGTSTSYLDWKTGDNPHLDVAGGNYTIMAWFKYNYSTTNGGGMAILEIGEFTNKYTLTLERGTSETRGTAGFVHNTNWYTDAGSGLNNSAWHQLVAVMNGTEVSIYIDGVNKSFTTFLGSYTQAAVSRIASAGNYESFNGSIDEIRFWNRSLGAQEILEYYTGSLNKYDIDKWTYITNHSDFTGGNYTYSAIAFDTSGNNNFTGSMNYSNGTNSVNNAPTVPILLLPVNASIITNRSPVFAWNNSNDTDGDTVTYTFQLSLYSNFSNLLVNVTNLSNQVTNTSYNLSSDLTTLDTTYYWLVRGYDGTAYGTNATGQFTLSSLLSVSLPTSAVSFGTMALGATKNTTQNDFFIPIIISNDGNVHINVTVNATRLFTSTTGTTTALYQFLTTENNTNANISGGPSVFTNLFQAPQTATSMLKYRNSTNTATRVNLHLLGRVPSDEGNGTKTSNITITFVQG